MTNFRQFLASPAREQDALTYTTKRASEGFHAISCVTWTFHLALRYNHRKRHLSYKGGLNMTDSQSLEMKFNVHIHGLVNRPLSLSYSDFTEGKLGELVKAETIVPAFEGFATRVPALLELVSPLPDCTHVVFHASDEFQATLPLGDLKEALLLFQQESGAPLKKGFPVRLLVPNGSSDCLNVKSVVEIDFVKHPQPEEEATFGFKNIVSAEQL